MGPVPKFDNIQHKRSTSSAYSEAPLRDRMPDSDLNMVATQLKSEERKKVNIQQFSTTNLINDKP